MSSLALSGLAICGGVSLLSVIGLIYHWLDTRDDWDGR